ncbi:MAG: SNF2 family helicase [Clostridia bacterium]|nr:SNF2 family helicase [Clostridia bacterium]
MPITLAALDPASAAYRDGESAFRRGSCTFIARDADSLRLRVATTPVQAVTLTAAKEPLCTCGQADTPCIHVVAALFAAQEDGGLHRLIQRHERALGQRMLTALSPTMPGGENVRIQPQLRLFTDGRVGLGLAIGQERMYAVQSILELLTCHTQGISLNLSPRFTFHPAQIRFTKEDERLLAILETHLTIPAEDEIELFYEQDLPEAQSDGRFIIISGVFLHSVLSHLETRPFLLVRGKERRPHSDIRAAEQPLCFTISQHSDELCVSVEGIEDLRMITCDCRYVLTDGRVVRLRGAQARICRMLLMDGGRFRYDARDAEEILSTLLPALSAVGTVIPSPELAARLITASLKPKIYLDWVNGNVVAKLEFHYGDVIVLPLEAQSNAKAAPLHPATPGPLLMRDGRGESALLDILSDAGFIVKGGRAVLGRAKDILTFCVHGVQELSKKYEVYATAAFQKIKPRRASWNASFRLRGGKLIFTLLAESGEAPALLPLLTAIRNRQHYLRLKTGEFLDIRDMAALAPIAQELLDSAALDDPQADDAARELRYNAYRAVYMASMLRLAGISTQTDKQAEKAAVSLTDAASQAEKYIPAHLLRKLVPYQRRGVGWLLALYENRMGGILADEMGLGKTVQVIAALSAAKKKGGSQKSIIITPTSLSYHWLAEFQRFDRALVIRMISGKREERKRAVTEIKIDETVDVILTSYSLLLRDIDMLKEIPLRFAILDEAQFVKNANSLGFAAVKDLDAQVRIALTGTPMENHTGELWSLFDFVLPGYLGTQSTFLRRYGGGEQAGELQERIRPFLVRRLKKDVRSDLPQKHEQFMYAAMTPEQDKVYRQLMGTLRSHVESAIQQGQLSKARMQILSILLKLRQACCHPKLFLGDYEGTSGKLELLVQTVFSAIAEKRRMLVFSQFVSMLQIIRKRLSREGVHTLYLDGETKPDLRQELCDRFNDGEGHVLLISLKAGGTGLNLTGADLVILYDPWWNPAAEDQAADRAHRIGQTRDVDVLRFIAQGTIEEKVTDLSKRKRAIFDRVVLAGESALKGLTEEAIRALFF